MAQRHTPGLSDRRVIGLRYDPSFVGDGQTRFDPLDLHGTGTRLRNAAGLKAGDRGLGHRGGGGELGPDDGHEDVGGVFE